jgi:hypothetical protein
MDAEQSSVNPWVRTNLEQYNDETLALIPAEAINEYVLVVDELALSKNALQLAFERVNQAEAARQTFYRRFTDGV